MTPERVQRIIDRIDRLNGEDPHTETVEGKPVPFELLYARRLTEWALRLNPQASEELRIAARGQHVRRWTIPRERYPRNRQGYLRWRETLKAFHIDTVTSLMREEGALPESVERVRRLMSKRSIGEDAEAQTLEDALCLVFLETQFADLRTKEPAEKMVEILRKTWVKMSERARAEALKLPLGEPERQLLERALPPS
jgi:hypothetical protein